MITIANQFVMKEALEQLGVKTLNEGTSTGINHFSNGEILDSYSPVDGQLIASVKTTSPADYEKVITKVDLASIDKRCRNVDQLHTFHLQQAVHRDLQPMHREDRADQSLSRP